MKQNKYIAIYLINLDNSNSANSAGIKEPGLHDFRRCFAVQMLRGGCDLVTLSRLMGHSSIVVTQRYLYLVDEDLKAGHQIAGPIDNAGW
jgi:site-specific recombinase XerD